MLGRVFTPSWPQGTKSSTAAGPGDRLDPLPTLVEPAPPELPRCLACGVVCEQRPGEWPWCEEHRKESESR